jgi:hypothetical protein
MTTRCARDRVRSAPAATESGMFQAAALSIVFGVGCAHPGVSPPPAAATPRAAAKPPVAKPIMATWPDGVRIAYTVNGAGRALILLHGSGQKRSSRDERGYVKALARSRATIRLRWPTSRPTRTTRRHRDHARSAERRRASRTALPERRSSLRLVKPFLAREAAAAPPGLTTSIPN